MVSIPVHNTISVILAGVGYPSTLNTSSSLSRSVCSKFTFTLHNAVTYSRVFGRYITEGEVTYSGNGDTTNNNTDTSGGGGTTVAATTRQASADANTNGRYDVKGAVNVKSTDKTIEDKANVWLGIATEVVTAKMTAVEAINKSFMQIIKSHVQYYVGRTDIENDQASRQGTDYSKYRQDNNQTQTPTGSNGTTAATGATGGQNPASPQDGGQQ